MSSLSSANLLLYFIFNINSLAFNKKKNLFHYVLEFYTHICRFLKLPIFLNLMKTKLLLSLLSIFLVTYSFSANRFWIGGTGNWSDVTHWSITSGGAGGASVPTSVDNAILDNNSGLINATRVVTMNVAVVVNDFDFSAVSTSFTLASALTTIEIRGSLKANGIALITYTGNINMFSNSIASVLQSNGQAWNNTFNFSSLGVLNGVTLTSSLNTLKDITHTSGILNSGGFTIDCSTFSSTNANIRAIDFTGSTLNIHGTSWNVVPGSFAFPLTWFAPSSIQLLNTGTSTFSGGNLLYNALTSSSNITLLNGSHTFSNVTLPISKTLKLANGSTNVMSSLVAQGTCLAQFNIETSDNLLAAAALTINGLPTWTSQGLIITNVNANGPTIYTISLSNISSGTGWSAGSAKYYWIGNSGNWYDPNHWSNTSGGAVSGCIPTASDSVFFNSQSFTLPNQTVTVNNLAYFKSMKWTGITSPQFMALDTNMVAYGDVFLNSNLSIYRNSIGSGIQFKNAGVFTVNGAGIDCNVALSTNSNASIVDLAGNLIMSDSSNIILFNGRFRSNNYSIQTGSVLSINNPSSGSDIRGLNLGSSLLSLKQKFSTQGDTNFVFNGSLSTIYIGDTLNYGNNLQTEGLTFNKVTLFFEPLYIGPFVLQQKITGNNTFKKLEILPGSLVFLDSAGNQTILDSLIIKGNCKDSISIYSTDTSPVINQANLTTQASTGVKSECVKFQGINAAGTAITSFFSTNKGSNSNIVFSTTPAVTANFNAVGPFCYGDLTFFNNNSTAISGNPNDITSIWFFNDGTTLIPVYGTTGYPLYLPDTTYITYEPDTDQHEFANGGAFNVILVSTYTNFCTDTMKQIVNINRPELFLNTSDIDKSICQGDNVTFEAGSSLPGVSFQFLLNGVSLNTPSVNDTLYITSALNDNDIVSAIGYLGGCPSDVIPDYEFNVNPLPTFVWTVSDANATICAGELVSFDANSSNATDVFRHQLNAANVTPFTAAGLYSNATLVNNDVVSMIAKSSLGCLDTVSMAFTVNPLPNTTLSASSAGSIICQNDVITYTASGANLYQFFINNVSQQGPSASATWTTSSLNTNDTVKVIGYNSVTGCSFLAPQKFTYTVLSLPPVGLTDSDVDNIVCSIDNVTFTASGAGLYTYYINGTAVLGPTASNSFTTTLSNLAAVHVVGSFGACTNSTTPTVFTVNTSPSTALTSSDADNTICLTSPVVFTASGASSYQYFVNGVSQGAPSTNPSFTTTALTNGETVLVNGQSNGCIVSSQLTFTVLSLPPVNLFSNDPDNTLCQGNNITLTGANAINYQLFLNGVSQGAVQTSPIFVNPTLSNGTNNLYVLGTGTNGCQAASSILQVTQNALPVMSIASSDPNNIICAGESVTFTGSGSTSYQFLINNVPQGGFSAANTFTTTGLLNGQSLTVIGSTFGCNSTSSAIVTAVNAIPVTQLSNNDGNNFFCTDQLVTFTATGASSFQFFVNGVSQGPSSATSTLTSAAFGAGIASVLVVGTSNGCTSTATNSVTVNSLPIATLSSSEIDNLICSGSAVTYTAAGGNQYQFFLNGVPQGILANNNQLSSTALNNGDVVSVNVVSVAGCLSNTTAVPINVNSTPNVSITSSDLDQQICLNSPVTFNFSGATTYQYFVNGIAQGAPSANTSFTTSSLTNGNSVYVTGTSNGCNDNSPSLAFTVFGSPSVTLLNNGNSTVCTGEAVDLLALGGINYQFVVNGVAVTGFTPNATYTGTVNNGDVVTVIGESNGCTTPSSQSISYTVNTFPNLSSSSSDLDNIICLNDAVTFNAANALSYEFLVNGAVQQANITGAYSISSLENGDVVSIIGYNGDCPSTADTYTFTVNSMDISLTVSPSSLLCNGTSATFTAAGGNAYQFYLNGVAQGAMSPTATFSSSSLNDNDQVTFTAYSNATLCTQALNDYISINVLTGPSITASTSPDFCEGDSVILTSSQAYGNQWYLNGNPITGATDTSYVVYASGDYGLESTLGGTGQVWSFGWNASGAFGSGTNLNNPNPTQALTATTFDEISSGANFVLGVTATGSVFAWGENSSGQLGNGTYTSSNVPVQVPTLANIKTIATTESSAMAVTNTGATYVWGNNTTGQLATGNTSVINFPFNNGSLANVDSVAGGKNHFVVLKNDGTVWTVGDNSFGQLGVGTLNNHSTAQQVLGLSNIVSVGAGEYHSFAISNIGDLYVWGNNGSGQLGLNDLNGRLVPTLSGLKNIVNAQGGATHSVFLKSNNKVYTSGGNDYGQLGTADLTDRLVPTLISISGVKAISAGQYTTLFLRNDLTVFGAGNNTEDQLSSTNGLAISTPEYISDLDGVTFIEASNLSSHFIFGESTTCTATAVSLNMVPVTAVTITGLGDQLSTVVGNSYQWYYNGNIIPGAVGQTLTATSDGYYSVEVTFGTLCPVMSEQYPYNVVGLDELSHSVKVYPNPTTGTVFVELPSDVNASTIQVSILDMAGRLIEEYSQITSMTFELDLGAYTEGVYRIEIRSDAKYISRSQVIKTN